MDEKEDEAIMRKERILAVIMSMLLVLSMIPATVFAAELSTLDGKLKIQGTAAESRTLGADFKEVKPEGMTEDDVTYLWQRKTVENEEAEKAGEKPELKELGKEKTYVVTQEDIGSKIVLTITGKEDKGYSGSLTVTSDTVIDAQTAADQEAKATEEQITEKENNKDASAEQDTAYQEEPDEAGTESVEGIPAATTEEENQQEADAGSEAVEGIPEATEDGTYGQAEDTAAGTTDEANSSETDLPSPSADIQIGDGSADTIDFGTVTAGKEDSVQAQYVTVSNTGNTTLNFSEISPEHFMVQDIANPMEQNSSQQLWIIPRAGVEAGSYEDTITYTSDEGVSVSFVAKMTVASDENEQPEAAGNSSDEAENRQADNSSDNTDTDPEETLTVEESVKDGLSFTSMESQTVNITNNSAQAVTVAASTTGSTPTVTVSPAEQEIQPGENGSFTVTPIDTLEADTPYLDNIRFADKADDRNELIVPVNVTIPAPAVSNVTADTTSVEFGNLVEGYTELPDTQTITLINGGNADADMSEAVSDKGAAKYFDIIWQPQNIAANGGEAQFKIQPKAGLTANNYTETFTITNNNNSSNSIVITATVNVETARHTLDVSTTALEFATAKKGYSEVAAQKFTVTNNGNVTETLQQPALTNFNVSVDATQLALAPGATATYTIQPKTGLDVGAYSETLKITSDKSVTASFQVVKGTASLTKIQQPTAITGLPNGTKKDASSLKLPSTVVIETTGGSMKASVSWNVKDASYKQSATEAQKFTVAGTVKLPSGVDNDNQVSLSVSVDVSVNAYSAKVASAENNKITGIEPNGVYTTQSKISFTAVGAGMDNNSPKKGDTRYVPQSWTVINTNVWNAAPYTASFGLAQSGDYTLKVAFIQQQYDGNTWKDTGSTDTRQVAFSITKAKITAPGTNLTPAANKKNAVKTGDNTPILPFVVILFVAAVAIGGVVFYKKKNKK